MANDGMTREDAIQILEVRWREAEERHGRFQEQALAVQEDVRLSELEMHALRKAVEALRAAP